MIGRQNTEQKLSSLSKEHKTLFLLHKLSSLWCFYWMHSIAVFQSKFNQVSHLIKRSLMGYLILWFWKHLVAHVSHRLKLGSLSHYGLRSPVPLYTLFYICKISAKQNQTSMFKTKQNKTGAKTTNSTFFSYYQLSIKPKNASNLKHGKQMYLEKRANLLVHTCLYASERRKVHAWSTRKTLDSFSIKLAVSTSLLCFPSSTGSTWK